ncbi:MAG: TIGR00270 family protein [Methanophagales archaeon ANME-1-THS]|nr:MAG: TIGR00270 family protein [Methanophagales archaeon ANME-1-THS]
MTECEICGVEIRGKARYIAIGSSKLQVCQKCAQYGSEVMGDKDTRAKTTPVGEQAQLLKAKRRLYEQMDLELEAELDIGEDYGRRVKEAREKAGLKQAELAKLLNEKQSLVRKIENEEIVPSKEVWGKLERILKAFL